MHPTYKALVDAIAAAESLAQSQSRISDSTAAAEQRLKQLRSNESDLQKTLQEMANLVHAKRKSLDDVANEVNEIRKKAQEDAAGIGAQANVQAKQVLDAAKAEKERIAEENARALTQHRMRCDRVTAELREVEAKIAAAHEQLAALKRAAHDFAAG